MAKKLKLGSSKLKVSGSVPSDAGYQGMLELYLRHYFLNIALACPGTIGICE